jgi:hypothetical protein
VGAIQLVGKVKVAHAPGVCTTPYDKDLGEILILQKFNVTVAT